MRGYGESTHSAMVLYGCRASAPRPPRRTFRLVSVTRLLRPIGELRRATDSIGESDLTTQVAFPCAATTTRRARQER